MSDFVMPILHNCARCGMNHAELIFREFKHPVVENRLTYRWWASCPMTDEPILMRQLLDEEAHNAATQEDPRYVAPDKVLRLIDRTSETDADGAKSG